MNQILFVICGGAIGGFGGLFMISMFEQALNSNDPLTVAGAFIAICFIVGLILSLFCYAVVKFGND